MKSNIARRNTLTELEGQDWGRPTFDSPMVAVRADVLIAEQGHHQLFVLLEHGRDVAFALARLLHRPLRSGILNSCGRLRENRHA
jgi:hypothetical protein